ncbi:uncharacterized protein LOC144035532 isoform X2 [Vanacampus margaritifer]
MPIATRHLFVFVLVCAAVMSSITRLHFARASPVSVLGTDVMKASSNSPYSQYLLPSSGHQSSQLQNTNYFRSRQRGQDYKPFQPEMTGPANRLFVRQGKNLHQYPVVVLKSAPGHPLHQSSRNAKEEPRFEEVPRLDAPKIPARMRGQSGVKSVWQTSSVLLTGGRKFADESAKAEVPRMSSGIRPGRFPLRRLTSSSEKTMEVSVFKHSPQPEKLTSSLANDKEVQSFLFKPSFVRREEFGKPLNSLAVSKIETDERVPKYSRTMSAKEEDNARVYFPRHFAAQSHKDKHSANVVPPVSAIGFMAVTTRKPVHLTSSRSNSKLLGVKRSRWPGSLAFASDSPTNKGKSYTFKMANVYPALSSKYSFSRRKVEPRTTAASSTTEFRHPPKLDRRLLRQPSNQVKGANTASSSKSAVQQNFEGLDQNISQFASTSPIPETSLQHGNEVLAFGNEQNGTQTERQTSTGAMAGRAASEGTGRTLDEGKSRLFGTSTSSTVRGRRVHSAHRAGLNRVSENSPIIRLNKWPKSELMGNASTTQTLATASFPNVTKLGVRFFSARVPVPNGENRSPFDIDKESKTIIKTNNESSDIFDSGTYETLLEDLLELNYLRISTGNVSFKSI